MKKIFKTTTFLVALLTIFASCNATPAGTAIGTIGGKPIYIPYFSEIFVPETSSSNNETSTVNEETSTPNESTEEQSSGNNAAQQPKFDKSSAILVSVVGSVFENTDNKNISSKKLNTALNNLKGQHGDQYLKKAEETYKLPVKTEADLIRILKFSLMYSNYQEKLANLTDAQISEEYFKSYAVKFCAKHALIEDKTVAQTMLTKINTGEKTFNDYVADAQKVQDATPQDTQNNQQQGGTKTLKVNDAEIDGIKVKEFSDLGCQPASTYVGAFGQALQTMPEQSVSSQLVETQYGYHIIQLNSIQKTDLTSKVQEQVKSSLIQKKLATPGFSSYYLNQLIDGQAIEITNEEVKKAYDEYKKELVTSAESYTPPAETQNNTEQSEANTSKEASDENNGA